MVYFKEEKDKKFRPMSLKTGEIFNRLLYAPLYPYEILEDVKGWIDYNKKCAPECKIQIRVPGTQKVIYQ